MKLDKFNIEKLRNKLKNWNHITKKMKVDYLIKKIQKYLKNRNYIRKKNKEEEKKLENISIGEIKFKELLLKKYKRFFLYQIIKNNKILMLKRLINKNYIEIIKKRFLKNNFKKIKLKTLNHVINNIRKIQNIFREYIKNKNNKKQFLLEKIIKNLENKRKNNDKLLLSLKFIQLKNKCKTLQLYIPANKIQKVFRGFLTKKYILPKIKEFNKNVNIQKMKLVQRAIKLFPIVKKKDNYLIKYFNKWRYESVLNPLLTYIKKKIKSDFDLFNNLLKYNLNKWKIISRKMKCNEKAKIIQIFIKNVIKKKNKKVKMERLLNVFNKKEIKMKKNDYFLKYFFTKFNTIMKKDKENKINNIKQNLIINQLEKLSKIFQNQIMDNNILFFSSLKNYSIVKKRNNILKNLIMKTVKDIKEKNLLNYYFNLFHIKSNKKKLKQNSELISNFIKEKFDNFKKSQNRRRWRKISRNLNTNNKYKKRIILFKLARLPFLFNKKNIIQKQRIIYPPFKKFLVNQIYKVYFYKVLSKLFKMINDKLKNNTLNTFIQIKKASIEYSKYNCTKNFPYHEKIPHLLKFKFKEHSTQRNKKKYKKNDLYIERIIPYFINYINKLRNIVLKYVLNNIEKTSNIHLFIDLSKNYIKKKIKNYKNLLFKNLKENYLIQKLYFLIRMNVIKIFLQKCKLLKRMINTIYLIQITQMHKRRVKRKYSLKIIKRWKIYVKMKLFREWQLQQIEENFVETYERLADGMFGNDKYEPSIQKQVQDFMEKTDAFKGGNI